MTSLRGVRSMSKTVHITYNPVTKRQSPLTPSLFILPRFFIFLEFFFYKIGITCIFVYVYTIYMYIHTQSTYVHMRADIAIHLWIHIVVCLHFPFFFKRFYLFIYFQRGEGKEKERQRNINVWLPPDCPPLGAWPATQSCTLTGNQTSNPLVHRPVLNPLNHTSQGWFFLFILLILYIAFFFFWIFKQPCNPGLNPYY